MGNKCEFCGLLKEKNKGIFYEDDLLFAILDSDPISMGHTLIIPKKHFKDIRTIPKKTLAHISLISQKIAKILFEDFKYESVSIMQSNGLCQDISHYHMHVFGRDKNNDLKITWPENKTYTMEDLYKITKLFKSRL